MRAFGADIDPVESREWRDAIKDVIERDGPDRANHLLSRDAAIFGHHVDLI